MPLLNTADALYMADREASHAFLGANRVFTNLELAVQKLFAAGEQGVWFDNAALDTLFADSAGTTPATVNGLIGLQLDRSRNGATGATLAATTWTNASWDTFAPAGNGFTASKNASGGTDAAYSNETLPVVLGRLYKIEFNVSAATASIYHVMLGLTTNGRSTQVALSGTGAKTCYVRANVLSGDFSVVLSTTAVGSVSIDSVVVTEILGNYRYQDTTAFKPILRGSPVGTDLLAGAGAFDSATGWILGSGYSISGGKLNRVNTGASANATYTLPTPLTSGRVYRVTYTLESITGSCIVGLFAGGTTVVDTTRTAAGTYEAYLVATSNHGEVRVVTGTATSAYVLDNLKIDDVSADVVQAPYFLRYDGVDDFLQTNAIDFTGTDKMTVWSGIRKLGDAITGTVVELSSRFDLNNGSFALFAPPAASNPNALFFNRGTAQAGDNEILGPAPVTAVITAAGDISGDLSKVWVNGVSDSEITTDQGAGNYGNYPLYMGRRGGSSLPFSGHEYQLIVRGAASSPTQLEDGELLTAQRTGVTLA